MPAYTRNFLLFLVFSVVTTLVTYFGLEQQARSPAAEEWMFAQIGDIENPTAGIVLLIPSFTIGFTAMWAMIYAFSVGLLIAPWELHLQKHRRALAAFSLMFILYAAMVAISTLLNAVSYYRWGFVLLSAAYGLWLVAIGWGIALVTGRCRGHIEWLLQRNGCRTNVNSHGDGAV